MDPSSLRCTNCGALTEAGRGTCEYCGALASLSGGEVALHRGASEGGEQGKLIAAGFGTGAGTWNLPSSLARHGVVLALVDSRRVSVTVPPATEIGEAIIPCSWVPGEFADIDAAVAVAFSSAPEGVAAGFWLRNSDESAITIMLWPTGTVTIGARLDHGNALHALGRAEAPPQFRGNDWHVLRARLVLDLVTVYRDGQPVVSVSCPAHLRGTTELRVQVAERERADVRFGHPAAQLP